MKQTQKLNLWNKISAQVQNGFGVATSSVTLPEYEQMIKWMDKDQAIDFHRPLKTSPSLENVVELIRKHVPPIKEDRVFYHDINNIRKIIDSEEIIKVAQEKSGVLL